MKAIPWEESKEVVVREGGSDTMRAPITSMQAPPTVPPAKESVCRPSLSIRTVS
jgi:hypothetical protein